MAAILGQLIARSCLFAALVSPSRVFTRCYNLPHVPSVTFKRFHSAGQTHRYPLAFCSITTSSRAGLQHLRASHS